MSRIKESNKIKVKIDLDKEDLTPTETKATYSEIKAYILEKYNTKVSSLYIAQVKRKYGIIERENYNLGKGKIKNIVVTKEKEELIINALRHFKMIK